MGLPVAEEISLLDQKEYETKKKRMNGKGRRSRLLLTSAMFIAFLLGVPVWWRLTRIYRSPLLLDHFQNCASLAAESQELHLPLSIHVMFDTAGMTISHLPLPDIGRSILEQINARSAASNEWLSSKSLSTRISVSSLSPSTYSPSSKSSSTTSNSCSLFSFHSLGNESLNLQSEGLDARDRRLCSSVLGDLRNNLTSTLNSDIDFDKWLKEKLTVNSPSGYGIGEYTILVTAKKDSQMEQKRRDNAGKGHCKVEEGLNKRVTAVVGQYRHAWLEVGESMGLQTDAVCETNAITEAVAAIAWTYFLGGGREEKEVEREGGGGNPLLSGDGDLVLSFSLLNAHPEEGWLFDWDFAALERQWFGPLAEALLPLAGVTLESQVLHYIPMDGFQNVFWNSSSNSHEVLASHWSSVLSPSEWRLDSWQPVIGSRVLHFVAYIPPKSHSPLRLRTSSRHLSSTNAFSVPGWGGVAVLNPEAVNASLAKNQLSSKQSQLFTSLVLAQLRGLLGLPVEPFGSRELPVSFVPNAESGFCLWESDWLLRRRVLGDFEAGRRQFLALGKLVRSLPSLVIKDEIGRHVAAAQSALELAKEYSKGFGNNGNISFLCREGRKRMEAVFYDSSMMSNLYYPFEHHMAVYAPFFLPVWLHIMLSFGKEVVRLWKEN